MGPVVDAFAGDERLPARSDVVVVGGGIIGVSAALALAQRGVSVTLCEKGHIAGEQSSRNWGWVRKTGRDQREIPLIIESLRLWEGMNQTVEAETGFRACGIFFAANDDAERRHQEAWLERAMPYQMGTRMVGPAEAARLLPGAAGTIRGGLYTASDGRAEPQRAAPAIAAAARRLGATVLTGCAARGVERTGGRVTGVVTERGAIACEAVILAGGAWSRLFCGSLGLRLPQLKIRASVLRTAPLDGPPEVSAWLGDFAFRKRLDGGYSIANGQGNIVPLTPDSFAFWREFLPALRAQWRGLRPVLDGRFAAEARTPRTWRLDAPSPFEAVRVLDPAPDRAVNARTVRKLVAMFPAFAGARVAQEWAGMIDVTPDAVPVISPVEALPGLTVATGFSGHGFGIGPAAGRLAADLATGARPLVDPTPFRFSRFSDGSPIVVEAGF